MQREGKVLKVLKKGDKRRPSDARNAWRNMSDEQRHEHLNWIIDEAEAGSSRVRPPADGPRSRWSQCGEIGCVADSAPGHRKCPDHR